jgi:hypothetical protein
MRSCNTLVIGKGDQQMTSRQAATEIRAYLRAAGPMVPVRTDWLAKRLRMTPSALLEALSMVETRTFRLMRASGQGATVAMA